MLKTESTSFTKDVLGRYLCNTFQEAVDSTRADVRLDARPFDVIVIGGGTFGASIAEQIFQLDAGTRRHRILVLEGGPFLLPEHLQNLPPMQAPLGPPAPATITSLRATGADRAARNEVWGLAWHSSVPFPGLAYCVGGRSLFWGGWSPDLIDSEVASWPEDLVEDLRERHLPAARRQLGLDVKNDFIFGPLHDELRSRLFAALQDERVSSALPVDSLGEIEAPLAVQSAAPRPGYFPFNKFSAVPLLHEAARAAQRECGGDDFRKRLMVVPNCHVIRLTTDGSRVGTIHTNLGNLAVPAHAAVVVALGTIESTRLALLSFGHVPHADLIGRNLMAHLRSNLTIRIPRSSFDGLPPELQASALFVKGRHAQGHFHVQITGCGVGINQGDSEAEMFKKVPDIDGLDAFQHVTDEYVVMTLRGIGEMRGDQGASPSSRVGLDGEPDEYGAARARVSLAPSADDLVLWDAMDAACDDLAREFADGALVQYLVPNTSPPQWRDTPPDFGSRRDGLGTTHHETGTLWMGDAPNTSVTTTTGRFHAVPNAYAVGPALFPTIGSPNPMLNGTAMVRRTARAIYDEPNLEVEDGFSALFDGATLDGWRMAGPGRFLVARGTVETQGGMGLLWYAPRTFRDFVLRLDWMATHPGDNSGVFVRFPAPGNDPRVAVNQGYEVQIDDQADPLHRTGAIYGFAPAEVVASNPIGQWNTFEIRVSGQEYRISLNGTETTRFTGNRGTEGYVGLQNHDANSRVVFRRIRIRSL